MYKLLPFSFTRIAGHEILVNEVGDMQIVPLGTVEKIVEKQLDEKSDLFKTLHANFFLSDSVIHPLFDIYVERLAEKKSFLDSHTALHIFVLTLRCNQNCVYCQASSQQESNCHVTMTKHTMKRSVELMFRSRSPHLTMEFQGGEPSLEFELLKYGIELAEKRNIEECRQITYVLCTNSINLTDRVLELCKRHRVLISTSLDGPDYLHNKNRGKTDSYNKVAAGIAKAREALGFDRVSALMTTSVEGLNYPIEIVDEYVKLKFSNIFIRALNPYGLATNNENWDDYTNRFIEFYKQALNHIIDLNKRGVFFREEYATIILKKMITSFNSGFVDLQSPAGIVNSVIVYNYDGYVYASDESRMLAEMGDYTFRIGSVDDDYEQLVYCEKVKNWAKVWANETLAGCSDCALKTYCGADPVRNHSTQGDIYGFRPGSLLCKKNKAIIEYIIELIITRGEEVLPIFKSWFL